MALIAACVLRYRYTVSPPRVDDVSDKFFVALHGGGFDWSCVQGLDSITSASNGNRSSRFASHSWTNLVICSVVKKG